MRVVTVLGARPQFIKASVVSRHLRAAVDAEEILVHTGQHFDANMSEIFFRQMGIPEPKHNLGIHSLPHGAMTGRMLERLEQVLLAENPDCVLVYGDTNSTLAAALAARKLHLSLAHVEAGLRSFNLEMPEEVNRVLTDRVSDLLFCPTAKAVQNLEQEGFARHGCRVVQTGDVMYDAALHFARESAQQSDIIKRLGLNRFVLATIHRQENTDHRHRLQLLVRALNKVQRKIDLVMPVHPRTRSLIDEHQLEVRFRLLEPVGYFDMLELLKHCALVMTDSGGMQKESFFFEKHCLTLRDQTEWLELVEHGFNLLAGDDEESICSQVDQLLARRSDFSRSLYGTGNAGEQIVEKLQALSG